MASLRKLLVAAAALVATSQAAHAADFYTPVAQSNDGNRLACVIVNVSASAITVSARMRALNTGADIAYADLCPKNGATLAPGTGCIVWGHHVGAYAGYCQFTSSSSRVRANLLIMTVAGDTLLSVPATK
jgi:uncharacterized protein YdbL (DUF1318 family)